MMSSKITACLIASAGLLLQALPWSAHAQPYEPSWNQCACATWPSQACSGNSITISVDDPRNSNDDEDYGNQGNATITFDFDKNYTYGCFANSFDVWVLDDGTGVDVTRMSPAAQTSPIKNGAMIDPMDAYDQAWDCRSTGVGEASCNPSELVQPPVDLAAKAKNRPVSLIKSYGLPGSLTNNGPVVALQYVLTAVTAVPANNGATVFRPPYTGNSAVLKPMYSTNSIRWNLIPDVSASGLPQGRGTNLQTPNDMNFVTWCRLPVIDSHSSWNFNVIHGHFNNAEYGVDNHMKYVNCPVTAMLDHWGSGVTNKERELVIASIQQGIDIFWRLKIGNGFGWSAGAGFSASRVFAPAFAATMLDDSVMLGGMGNRFTQAISPDLPAGNEFGEDGHIWKNPSNGTIVWGECLTDVDGPGCNGTSSTAYNSSQFNQATGLGSGNARDPLTMKDAIAGGYQGCCSSSAFLATVVGGYLMPEVADVLIGANGKGKNLFDYVERFYSQGFWGVSESFYSYHGDSLTAAIYSQHKSCLRSTKQNGVGQNSLDQVTRSCAGQVGSGGVTIPPPLPVLAPPVLLD
jgi:hypothetical protein